MCSKVIEGVRYEYPCPPKITDPVLQRLQDFVNWKAKQHLELPVYIWLKKFHDRKVAEPFHYNYHFTDKQRKPVLLGYGIYLDIDYFRMNKHDENELKQTVIHELAHLISDKRSEKEGIRHHHDHVYKKIAKEMGADKEHQKMTTSKEYYVERKMEMIKRKRLKPQPFKYARKGDVFIFVHKGEPPSANPEFWIKVNEEGYMYALKYSKQILKIPSDNQPIIIVDHTE
jgi:predicted SprT family Zn-dependent metalloprotease